MSRYLKQDAAGEVISLRETRYLTSLGRVDFLR